MVKKNEENKTKAKKSVRKKDKTELNNSTKDKNNKCSLFLKKHLLKKMSLKGYEILSFSLILVFVTIAFTCLVMNELKEDNGTGKTYKYKDKNLKEFEEVYDLINDSYYKEVNKKELIDGAINGMLESLDDPHTSYFTKEETQSFNEVMNGSYEGIGAEISINNDGKIIVHSVFKNSPAYKEGLQFNDIILEVNGKSTEGITTTETVALIKDPKKPTANIIIERNGQRLEFNIKKEKVVIESVESDTYQKNGKNIGYVRVNNFANNTYQQFKEHIEELEKNNIDSLIIDVRGNSGGYLHSVTSMLDLFISKNNIIYQIEGRKDKQIYKAESYDKRQYPIAVLINKASASASEILAISLNESYGAIIVGTESYGKGTVQVTKDLSGGAMIKYTIQKWLSPNGNWINEVGVKPTIEVELSEEYLQNPIFENDNQLQRALEELSKK